MEFRQCSVAGKVYGRNGWGGKTDAEKGKEIIQGTQNEEKQDSEQMEDFHQYVNEMKDLFEPIYSSTDPNFLTFVDPEIFRDLKDKGTDNDNGEEILEFEQNRSEKLREFFTLLAVCHTVVVDEVSNEAESSDGSTNGTQSNESKPKLNLSGENGSSTINLAKKKLKNKFKQALPSMQLDSSSPVGTIKSIPIDKTVVKNLIYKAESPDEAALVAAAKNLGFVFLSRKSDSLTVDILGKEHVFKILNILEFNSTRKRMSVIVNRPAELGGGIAIFCKGADNVIIERLAEGQEDFVERTYRDIEDFSNDGMNI
jgi:phospholipid-translocating ATPase